MNRYAAYVRISREDQSVYSLESQQQAIEKWVRVQGGELFQVYTDDGYTGRNMERPAFKRLREDATHRRFDAVVVHRFDRFARNSVDALALKSLFRRDYGIKVYSVTEPSEDTHGEVGALIEAILDMIAEWYSRNLSSEVAKGRFQKAAQGYHNNQAPFGMQKAANGVLIPKPEEIPALELAFELYATGNYSDNRVARKLNSMGYRNRKGDPFQTDGIRAMLQNRTYLGYVRYQENRYHPDGRIDSSAPVQWFEGQHRAVIDEQLFEKCQQIRASRASSFNTVKKHRFYLLRDIIYCAECVEKYPENAQEANFGKMRPQSGGTTDNIYYRCCAHDFDRPCSQKSVNALKIEAKVVRKLMTLKLPEEARHKVIHAVAEILDKNLQDERLEKVKTIIERMDFEKQFGFILKPYAYLQQHVILQRKIDALPPLPKDSLEKAADLVEHFARYWYATAGDREAQEALVHLLVEKVWTRDNKLTGLLLKGNCKLVLD